MKNSYLTLCASILLTTSLLIAPTLSVAENVGSCGLCGTEITAGSNLFEIKYKNGTTQTYGCPACGLTMMHSPEVASAQTMDFLSRKMLDAKNAYYLKDTEVGYCCEPHWLSFETKENAEKFAKGFGGKVLSYQQAIKAKNLHHQHAH